MWAVDREWLRRPSSSLHWMLYDDAALIEAIATDKLSEAHADALRSAGCGELADDWRLALTLLWIAASEVTSFEGLNESMGGTVGLGTGRILDFLDGLRAGSYLVGDRDRRRFDHDFALTAKGRLAADLLRADQHKN